MHTNSKNMPNQPDEQATINPSEQETIQEQAINQPYDRNDLYLYTLRKMAESNMETNLTNLTRLLNRRAFFYKSAEIIKENPDKHFAIMIMDISNFKMLNEFCSHETGDEILVYIADIFRDYWKRSCTVVSHFRADIFAMLTPFAQKEDLVEIAMDIHSRIDAFKLPYKVLASIGICIATSPEMSTSNMCDYASIAKQTIKGKFYAKYAFFDDKMYQRMLSEKQIENDIVNALASGQLQAYIQPKVDMRSRRILGGEALVRWLHPTEGIISPGRFIPVLEKNGLIIEVDFVVWTQVFSWLHERMVSGKNVVPISINISRMHAHDTTFMQRLISLADEFHVPPSLVILELTESSFLNDTDGMYESMLELKQYGFTLSMDDFGTGYSTMTMLKNLPVNEVKIDRGFIDDIENENACIILENVIHMLKALDKTIIIEGVEHPAQEEFLLKHNCFYAQGFMYYKPMPVSDFEALLDAAAT